MFNNFFFFENHAYGNVEKCSKGRLAMDDNIIRYMRVACWIIKATNTHSEPVILTDFPQQHFYALAYHRHPHTNNLFV